MKKIKRTFQLPVVLLLILMGTLISPSFAAVDQEVIQNQIQAAITAALAEGQEVNAALIETIVSDIMTQNILPEDDPVLQVEALTDAIIKAVITLNENLGLSETDVVLAVSQGAVQGVSDLVTSGVISETLSSAVEIAAYDGVTAGAQTSGVSMDTILLIGSTPPADTADTPDAGEAEAFEPAEEAEPVVTSPPPVSATPLQDLAASSPM